MSQENPKREGEDRLSDYPCSSRLQMARRALEKLEARAAGFGSLHMPVDLEIELEDKRREVAMLEAQILPISCRIFASSDTVEELESACRLIEILNDHPANIDHNYQLELTHDGNDFDILIGITWRNTHISYYPDNQSDGNLNEEINDTLQRRMDNRPAIILYIKDDPKPLDYAYQDDVEQVLKITELLNSIAEKERLVVFTKFKVRDTISDTSDKFEFVFLRHLIRVYKQVTKG